MTAAVDQAAPVCAATGCGRPADPIICAAHTRQLGDWLAQLGTEYELLSAAPSMQGREWGTGGSGGLASQRSVGRLDVMVLRDPRSAYEVDDDPDGNHGRSVFRILTAYAGDVRERRNLALPAQVLPACAVPCMHSSCWSGVGRAYELPLTVATERKLLSDHLDWILGQDWCGEFFDEIRALWGLLRHANGHSSGTRRSVCRAPGCTGTVRWVDGAAVCGRCGHSVTGLDVLRKHAGDEAA